MDYCGSCDIAYEGKNCPLCEMIAERDNLDEEVGNLNDTINILEKRIQDLENRE